MSMVPSGKKRTMEAQSYSGDFRPDVMQSAVRPSYDGSLERPTALETQEPSAEDSGGLVAQEDEFPTPDGLAEVEQQDETRVDNSLNSDDTELKFVFDFLKKFRYPPRRLIDYEDDLVTEKMFPGGQRELVVIMPDKNYETGEKMPRKVIDAFVNEFCKKFDLQFVEGERKDKKVTLSFNSVSPEDEQAEAAALEGQPTGDILEEAFGVKSDGSTEPTKSSLRKRKKAETIQEIIKKGKSQLLDNLMFIVENNKVEELDPELLQKIQKVFSGE